jgi:hypothetical protein
MQAPQHVAVAGAMGDGESFLHMRWLFPGRMTLCTCVDGVREQPLSTEIVCFPQRFS